jgi:hypothetical protein
LVFENKGVGVIVLVIGMFDPMTWSFGSPSWLWNHDW